MKILFPLDGDCLTVYDGEPCENGVKARVRVVSDRPATVNQMPAEKSDGEYVADVIFDSFLTLLTVSDGKEETVLRVYYLATAQNTVTLTVEDNLMFLQDLTEHSPAYPSLFDQPYLAMFYEAHRKFGTKVTLNLFYTFDDEALSYFSGKHERFDLSMVTDAYKKEFAAASDWLKLTFHANSEFPGDPYLHATYAETARDIEAAHREIIRFAGESSLANSCNVHFGSASREAVRACRNYGYRCLSGFFTLDANGNPFVSHYLDKETVSHFDHRDMWYDKTEDMFFIRTDLILNATPYDHLIPALKAVCADAGRRSNLNLLMHEQYYHTDYCSHLKDYKALIFDALSFAAENGYRAAFPDEMIDETRQKRKS